MRFLGIDFGWSGKPSGLAALEWDGTQLRLIDLQRQTELSEILAWVGDQAGDGPAMVAVDAPLVIRNPTGSRDAEKSLTAAYRRFHAGCHPANLSRPFAQRTVSLSRRLQLRGFQHADTIEPRQAGRFQIEVYPHPACVNLFSLQQIIKYKRGRIANRTTELERFARLLQSTLPRLEPALDRCVLPALIATTTGLKEFEDQLDALLSAYIGAHWWFWGRERNVVYGDRRTGYIIVPAPQSAASNGVSPDNLRKDYLYSGLSEEDLATDPFEQFAVWFHQAQTASLREANAMTLATASPEGRPSARMVLLKGFDTRGFVFYSNYESRKGHELSVNPRAALVLYWPELERQVRIEGTVQRLPQSESEAYFQSRPLGSQVSAWASNQSQVVGNRSELEAAMAARSAEFGPGPAPLPPFWGGWRLMPESIEFWQGRASRLHDRLRYVRHNDSWRIERLAP